MANSASAFLDEKPSASDFLNSPTDLPSINEPTGAQGPNLDLSDPSSSPTAHVAPDAPSFDPSGIIKKLTPGPVAAGALTAGLVAAPETAGLSLIPAVATAASAGALGGMAGEAFAQLGQHFQNFVAGFPFGSGNAPSTSEDALSRIGEGGAAGGLQEGAGMVLQRGIVKPITGAFEDKVLNPVSDKFVSGGRGTIEDALAAQKEFGIPQTPAQATKSPVLQWFENKLRNNPKTAAPLREFDIDQLAKKVAARNTILDEGGATGRLEDMGLSIQNDLNRMIQKTDLATHPDVEEIKNTILESLGSKEKNFQLGLDGQAAVKLHLENLQAAKDAAYANVGAAMPPTATQVPSNFIESLKAAKEKLELGDEPLRDPADVQKQLGVIDDLLSQYSPQRSPEIQMAIDKYRAAGNEVYAKALEDQNPGVIPQRTYAQMDMTAKFLNEAGRDQFGRTGSLPSFLYGGMRSALRDDMENLATSTGNPDLISMHQAADLLNTDFKNTQSSKTLAAIMKAKPTAVSKVIFSPGNDQMIQDIQKTFPEYYPRVKAKFTNDLFDSGSDQLTGDTIRAKLANLGETANTIWNGTEKQQILQAADTIDGRIDFGSAIKNNPVFVSALKSNPTMVVDKFVQPERVGPIVLAKQFLPAETNQKIGSSFLRKTLVSDGNGGFDPQASLNVFEKYGRDVYTALYGTDKTAQLERYLKLAAADNTERNIAHVPARGQMSNSLLGFGAILYGMVTRPLQTMEAVAASWKIAPLLSKAYLSPFVADWMTKGIESPAALKAAIPVVNEVAGRFSAALMSYYAQQKSQEE